ncbi:uncharacterized protein LOC134751369 isoform X2 [Cydia strobilella]|uniref:uncharacterized protein LOC134751369 isoform X2 n=1 Tax=Cydia strobilella TaxID=1100964 RepID=UPI0030046E22
MPHRCAFGCSEEGAVLHVFPNPHKYPDRFKVWVKLIGGKLDTPSDYKFYNKKRICDVHFTDEHRNRFKRLNAIAVPTLCLRVTFGVPAHRFPHPEKHPDLFASWVSVIGEKLKYSDCIKIYKNKRVCDQHFHPKHKMSGRRLKMSAIPSVNLHRIRQNSSTFVQADHCYTHPQREYVQPVSLTDIRNLPGPYRLVVDIPEIPLPSGSTETCPAIAEKSQDRISRRKYDAALFLGNLPTNTADAAAPLEVQSPVQEDEEDEPAFEEDNQTESDSRLPNDEVMIDYIIEHSDSPGRDIFDTIEPEDPKKATVFSWEKTDLLEADDAEGESELVPETKIPEDLPTLSLFCDEPHKPPDEIAPSKPEAVVPKDVVYRCVDCAVVVDGFTFWCVQCLCGVLCGACAAMSPHNMHYVLRAPKGATLSQTQPVLLVIREQLQKENLLTLYGTDIDGVKVEVKLEPEEPLSPPAPTPPPGAEDPLALEPHSDPEEPQIEPMEPHSEAVQFDMKLESENIKSNSEAVHSVEGVEPQPAAIQLFLEGADPDSEALQYYLEPQPKNVESRFEAVQFSVEGVETQSEAVQFYVEGAGPQPEEPQTAAVQISLEGVEPQSEAVRFYLDGVEPHPEAVQFYLEAVERGTDAVLLQVESTAAGPEVELHHEALRLEAKAEKCVNRETVDHHHPFKRPRLMKIQPKKLYPTTSPKVSDVQQQTLKRIPPTIKSQTVIRLPNTIPSDRTGSQIHPKVQLSDLIKSKTFSKSSPTELLVPQNVHKVPNILRRPKTNKVELRKSTLLKQDKVQNIAKGSPLIRTQQINPRGSPLQAPQNVGFSELKVTSGSRRYETVIINSDDEDVEFLDEELLDRDDSENEVDSRLHKENQDDNRIGEELVGDIESELGNNDLDDRLDKEEKIDDEESDKNSSEDKESEIDDDDLDEDYKIDKQDRIDEDFTDETDGSEKDVGRRTRHATNTTVGSRRKMVRTRTSEAVVQLQRLTSLDIRNWTDRSKPRRKD